MIPGANRLAEMNFRFLPTVGMTPSTEVLDTQKEAGVVF